MVFSVSLNPVLNLTRKRSLRARTHFAGVNDTTSRMYATCSGLSCNRFGTGLLPAGKLRSNPSEPLYRPSPISVSIRRM